MHSGTISRKPDKFNMKEDCEVGSMQHSGESCQETGMDWQSISSRRLFGWESLRFGKITVLQTMFFIRPVGTGQPLIVAAIMGF